MITPRSKWAVYRPVFTALPVRPATHVFIHHAVSGVEGSQIDLDNDGLPDSFEDILRQIENFHITVRGWRAIAYNFLVGHKGAKAEGRGWGIEGGATGDWADDRGISICAVGDYHTKHDVTPELKRAFIEVIVEGIDRGELVPHDQLTIVGHQEKPYATACPGARLMDALPEIRAGVADVFAERARKRRLRRLLKQLRVRWRAASGKRKRRIGARIRRVRGKLQA